MILRAACAALLALASIPARTPPPADGVEAALLRHVTALADDAMEGRKPGTPGGEMAVRYIAGEMAAAGLKPGGEGGSWFRPVDLIERRTSSARMNWRIGSRRLDFSGDRLALLGRDPRMKLENAPLLYGGYGLPGNFDGVDVRGAIVLLVAAKLDRPGDVPSFDKRRDALAASGAAAVLTLVGPESTWRAVGNQYRSGRTLLANDRGPAVIGALAPELWSRLLREAGHDPARLQAAAAEPGFRALKLGSEADLRVKTAVRRYGSVNVVGRLPGAEPSQAVVLTAHWDHLGICRRKGMRDRICNGAVDNASGVASLLEVARALANGPRTTRGLYFVATTAEELGLLGARGFVRNPPIPLKSFVAGLNLDTVGIAPRGAAIAIIGRGMTRLDPLIEEAARGLNRKVDTGTAANAYVARQDGWALMEAGIPAVMVGGAFNDQALLERFFSSRYHGPGDDLQNGIELGGAAEDVALHVDLARLLADPKRFPAAAR